MQAIFSTTRKRLRTQRARQYQWQTRRRMERHGPKPPSWQNSGYSLRMEAPFFLNQKMGTHHFPVARCLLHLSSLGEDRLKRIVLLPSLRDSFVSVLLFFRLHQTRPNHIRPDQTTPDHIRPDRARQEQTTRPAPAAPPQVSHLQVAPLVFVSPPGQKRSHSVQ